MFLFTLGDSLKHFTFFPLPPCIEFSISFAVYIFLYSPQFIIFYCVIIFRAAALLARPFGPRFCTSGLIRSNKPQAARCDISKVSFLWGCYEIFKGFYMGSSVAFHTFHHFLNMDYSSQKKRLARCYI